MTRIARGALLAATALLAGCATLGALGQIVQPPTFTVDRSQQAQLRILGPSAGRPSGGLSLRLYARVHNPNPLGLTLTTLAGALSLEGQQAAQVSFPLGVPLGANQENVVPLDISISFSELPGLANVAQKALTGAPLRYSLNGTFGVDAGPLGRPTFGPTTLLEGDVRAFR
ncbi:MAG: Water Stress and Hypersensitive response protein [Gemmatimonadetes bacterium]|nr:Water Stress and Hypersensitive response protein [Gemmatimonadota bacterium]